MYGGACPGVYGTDASVSEPSDGEEAEEKYSGFRRSGASGASDSDKGGKRRADTVRGGGYFCGLFCRNHGGRISGQQPGAGGDSEQYLCRTEGPGEPVYGRRCEAEHLPVPSGRAGAFPG